VDGKRVHIITLGCPKNQVDSEVLAAQLKANGFSLAGSVQEADIAVVNTCGFIEAARQESVDVILRTVNEKSSGRIKKVLVTGCMAERYGKELKSEIGEIDAVFGTNQLKKILDEFHAEYKYEMLGDRILTTPPHYAYLKISEGCDNPCSFCAIPLMRGGHVSRKMEDVVHEAELLAAKGVKEIVIVGQDTSYYGFDIYGRRDLARLLGRLERVDGIEWIRLMYAYPSKFPLDILDVMRDSDKICRYIDIPVQHISDNVLKSMRRGITRSRLEELLTNIRERVPRIAIRTTLIVGYPSEGEKEFDELLRFVGQFKFDRLGAFTYSVEEGTPAAILGDPVPEEEKERRHAAVMETQREIMAKLNLDKVGTKARVIIDRVDGDVYAGRTEHDAPEIDSEVVISSPATLSIGSFVNVVIDDAYEHDLYGTTS